MADVWVFPGGAVDGDEQRRRGPPGDGLRELEEEASVALDDPGELVPFSRWITPEQVKVRYDTLVLPRAGAGALPPRSRTARRSWSCAGSRPREALEQHRAGELLLVFPTIKQAQTLAAIRSTPSEALASGRATPRSSRSCPAVDTSGRRAAGAAARRPGVTRRRPRPRGRRSRKKRKPSSASHEKLSGCGSVRRVDHDLAALERSARASASSSTRTPVDRGHLELVRARPCSRSNRKGAVESQHPFPITSERPPCCAAARAPPPRRAASVKHHPDPVSTFHVDARYTRAR